MLPFVDYQYPASEAAWNGIVLVGEAPGKEEARLGRPFVGRSGQLLDSMLEKAGIVRDDCLVANVFRYQPPGNKVDHFFSSKRAAVAAGKSLAGEMGSFGSLWLLEDYLPELRHLHRMLEERRPRAVLALGRTPFWALGGTGGLLASVGQAFDCPYVDDLSVIPTYHPSFILRGNWGLQDAWLGHFKEIAGADVRAVA